MAPVAAASASAPGHRRAVGASAPDGRGTRPKARAVRSAVRAASGTIPQNTQRHDANSASAPAALGPTRAGSTHAVDM